MTDRTGFAGRMKGHDARHRTRNPDTHPTHACSEHSCGFPGARMARPASGQHGIGAFARLCERAPGAHGRQPC